MQHLIKHLEFIYRKKITGTKRKNITLLLREDETIRNYLQEYYDDFTQHGKLTFDEAVKNDEKIVEESKKEFMDMINGVGKSVSDLKQCPNNVVNKVEPK